MGPIIVLAEGGQYQHISCSCHDITGPIEDDEGSDGELHQTVCSELGDVLGEGGWGQDHVQLLRVAQGPSGPGHHQPY